MLWDHETDEWREKGIGRARAQRSGARYRNRFARCEAVGITRWGLAHGDAEVFRRERRVGGETVLTHRMSRPCSWDQCELSCGPEVVIEGCDLLDASVLGDDVGRAISET